MACGPPAASSRRDMDMPGPLVPRREPGGARRLPLHAARLYGSPGSARLCLPLAGGRAGAVPVALYSLPEAAELAAFEVPAPFHGEERSLAWWSEVCPVSTPIC